MEIDPIKTIVRSHEESRIVYPIPLQMEIHKAKQVLTDTSRIIEEVMGDIRFGRQINTQKVDQTVNQITQSILRSPDALIALSRLKNKDTYTFQHSVSVSALLISFCRDRGLDQQTIQKVGTGGLLHDVGKMQVPYEILNKPAKLTHEEFGIIRKHVEHGRRILEMTPSIPRVAVMVASQHHERRNGSGYPAHVASQEISQYGQMAAIADVYDAATSQRPYHQALEPTEALRQIYEMRETFFDAELVEQFIKFMGIYPVGSLVALENGHLGVVLETNRNSLLLPLVRVIYDSTQGRPLPQHDLDLSRPTRTGSLHRIVAYESPEKWGLEPLAVLSRS